PLHAHRTFVHLCLSAYFNPSRLPPFPTRRSSDLPRAPPRRRRSCRPRWSPRPAGGTSRPTNASPARRSERGAPLGRGPHTRTSRSEEHTSELQSRFDLVCRLLLEKKKNVCLRRLI